MKFITIFTLIKCIGKNLIQDSQGVKDYLLFCDEEKVLLPLLSNTHTTQVPFPLPYTLPLLLFWNLNKETWNSYIKYLMVFHSIALTFFNIFII